MMRAALIVLSFNHVQETIDCLQSIFRSKPATADVIVVDNASDSGTVAELHRVFPQTEIIGLKKNLGWAGGNNFGIQLALQRDYDLICLMNNDLIVCEDALSALLQIAEVLEPCLLHPALYYYDDVNKAQIDPSSQDAPSLGQDHLYVLDFAYGACLTIHAEVFRTIGLMDERYFLQLEETDFYLRAVKAGFRSLCYTNARVLHKESISIGGRQSPTKVYYMVRNSLLITEKHASGMAAYAAGLRRLVWTLRRLAGNKTSLVKFLLWFCSHHGNAVAARAGIRDYALRRFGCMSDAAARSLAPHSTQAKQDVSILNTQSKQAVDPETR